MKLRKTSEDYTMFGWTNDGLFYKITKKLFEKKIRLAWKLEQLAPCSPGETATVHGMQDKGLTRKYVVERVPHRVSCLAEHPSTVCCRRFGRVTRITVLWSGIKRCNTSINFQCPSLRRPLEVASGEYYLASQIIIRWKRLYARMPAPWNDGSPLGDREVALEETKRRVTTQMGIPSWKYFSFGSFDGLKTSKLPGSIGFREYGRYPKDSGRFCARVPIPPNLEGAKTQIFQEMVNGALDGVLPETINANINCPFLPVSYIGSRFPYRCHR